METNALTHEIIGAAMRVHSSLGSGCLESTYHACLCTELGIQKLRFRSEVALPVTYRGVVVDAGYRIDLLVEDSVIVELKASVATSPVWESQLLSYLRLSGKSVGLLINFHVQHLRDGITRMVNNYRG
jgi:GxxExxY protein